MTGSRAIWYQIKGDALQYKGAASPKLGGHEFLSTTPSSESGRELSNGIQHAYIGAEIEADQRARIFFLLPRVGREWCYTEVRASHIAAIFPHQSMC